MKIIFDLDYTLLDTVAFKEALADAVTAHGPSRAEYEAAYRKTVKREGKAYDYDPDAHLELMRAMFPDDAALAQAREGIDKVLSETEKYLYPEARELLEAAGKHDADLMLMTLGNEKWQEAKVKHSGLMDLFDEVVATEKEKTGLIRRAGDGHEKVIVVNDNGEEMKGMQREAPEFTYILKRGPKEIPADLVMPTADTIGELAALLEKETGWELRREMKEIRREREGGDIVEFPKEDDAKDDGRGVPDEYRGGIVRR